MLRPRVRPLSIRALEKGCGVMSDLQRAGGDGTLRAVEAELDRDGEERERESRLHVSVRVIPSSQRQQGSGSVRAPSPHKRCWLATKTPTRQAGVTRGQGLPRNHNTTAERTLDAGCIRACGRGVHHGGYSWANYPREPERGRKRERERERESQREGERGRERGREREKEREREGERGDCIWFKGGLTRFTFKPVPPEKGKKQKISSKSFGGLSLICVSLWQT